MSRKSTGSIIADVVCEWLVRGIDGLREADKKEQDMGQDTRDWGNEESMSNEAIPFGIRPVEGNRQPVRRALIGAKDSADNDALDGVKYEEFGPDPYVQDGGKAMDEEQARNAKREWVEEQDRRDALEKVRKERDQQRYTPSYSLEDTRVYPLPVTSAYPEDGDLAGWSDEDQALNDLSDGILYELREYTRRVGRTPDREGMVLLIESLTKVVEHEAAYRHNRDVFLGRD